VSIMDPASAGFLVRYREFGRTAAQDDRIARGCSTGQEQGTDGFRSNIVSQGE